MFKTIMKLIFGRAMLLMLVDTTDKDDIQYHIKRLEHIRDKVVATAEEKRKRFGLFKFDHKLTLRDSDGRIKMVSRADNPKFLELLDYLHDNACAEEMSVRKLGDAVGVSKSLADEAKRYWAIEENRERFTAFCKQEDGKAPF